MKLFRRKDKITTNYMPAYSTGMYMSITSFRRILSDSPTNWSISRLIGTSSFTCSSVRTGDWITGPLESEMSKGTPMLGSGVSMSENRMTPSGAKARHGCSVISDRSRNEGCRLASAWYSAMYRPACRIIQAGGRGSPSSPRAARTSSGSSGDARGAGQIRAEMAGRNEEMDQKGSWVYLRTTRGTRRWPGGGCAGGGWRSTRMMWRATRSGRWRPWPLRWPPAASWRCFSLLLRMV
jgi:hypothetical protein